MQKKVRKAIIPAAGLGTRFLPATKAIAKEMLPIVDIPTIQYIIQEAVDSGIEEILIITNSNKHAMENHFDKNYELEERLKESGKLEQVKMIQDIADIFANYDLKTEIICASVRNPIHITACALAGADIATVPYKVIEQMVHHPLTDAGIEKFKKDYIAVFGE